MAFTLRKSEAFSFIISTLMFLNLLISTQNKVSQKPMKLFVKKFRRKKQRFYLLTILKIQKLLKQLTINNKDEFEL